MKSPLFCVCAPEGTGDEKSRLKKTLTSLYNNDMIVKLQYAPGEVRPFLRRLNRAREEVLDAWRC